MQFQKDYPQKSKTPLEINSIFPIIYLRYTYTKIPYFTFLTVDREYGCPLLGLTLKRYKMKTNDTLNTFLKNIYRLIFTKHYIYVCNYF